MADERTQAEGERDVEREVDVNRPDGTTINVDTDKEAEGRITHQHDDDDGDA